MDEMNKVEILAPAGSMECLLAALKSGADAIYVGGQQFGARANANNFTLEELKDAIDLVHLQGKQLYLTVNTLIKEGELSAELYDYILPLYEHGIDAVIVQDLGVVSFLKKFFPDLPIHGSTQMTITNLLGAQFLENLGIERVVTSRELSLEEVNEIKNNTKLDIESFVHGALCYSYSGQCLFSGMIGGRSGNRGQCAQPCRLPYSVEDKKGYFLSLKDICTLEEIPDLIKSGVYSFKIEGRMKKPEYVAGVTAMYRKYIDLYLKVGKAKYSVEQKDVDFLKDIFNRGDFHLGYWNQHNGKDMITEDKPSHMGVPALEIISQNGRSAKGKALRALNPGDILEIVKGGDNYTLGSAYEKDQIITLSLRKGVKFYKGQIVFRTRNQVLVSGILENLESHKLQQEIEGTLVLVKGGKASLHLQFEDSCVEVQGEEVAEALQAPLDEGKVRKQMLKTGNTPFVFRHLELLVGSDVFVPNNQLNQLRRNGLEALEQEILQPYRRKISSNIHCAINHPERCTNQEELKINTLVSTVEQLNVLLSYSFLGRIYLDCNSLHSIWNSDQLDTWIEKTHERGKEIYLVFPHIFRGDSVTKFQENTKVVLSDKLDGIMVRNVESFQFLKNNNYKGKLVLDHHVYLYNEWSNQFWKEQGIEEKTYPLELNVNECKDLNSKNMEMVVYGYTPDMISAQCVGRTTSGCNHNARKIKLVDRFGETFTVKTCCDYCYNVIYHYAPTSLLEDLDKVRELGVTTVRVDFTIESAQDVKLIIDSLEQIYYDEEKEINLKTKTTKGHFYQGVK